MTNETHFDVPDGRPDMTITRQFAAPAARIFDAHVDAEQIPLWWGPRYLTTVVDHLEARPGGQWRYVQHAPDGAEHAFHGFFHLVENSRRLVTTFEYEGTPGHVILNDLRFEDLREGSRLVQTSVHLSVASRDTMVEAGMSVGVLDSMQRIDELVSPAT